MKRLNVLPLCIVLFSSCNINNGKYYEIGSIEPDGCFVSDRISSTTIDDKQLTCNIRWTINQLPVNVISSKATLYPDQNLLDAINYINSAVGYVIFDTDSGPNIVNLEYVSELRNDPGITGEAFWTWNKFQIESVSIEIKDGLDDDLTRMTIVHELAHALSVSHDDLYCSIMSPGLVRECQYFLPEDIQALRAIYGNITEKMYTAETFTESEDHLNLGYFLGTVEGFCGVE